MQNLFRVIAIASVTLGTLVTYLNAEAQQPVLPPKPPSIVVTGTGVAKAAPDIAYVTLGVVTNGKRAQEASQTNATATDKVVASLKQLGIAEKDIQTNNYNVQPMYKEGNFNRGIDSYQVSNTVRATVRKLTSIGKVIDSALDSGANTVHGVAFGLEKREEAEAQALAEAVRDARRKADVIARASGVEIRGVLEIDSTGGGRPVPLAGGFAMEAMARGVATPIAPGELDINSTVTITYRIEPAAR